MATGPSILLTGFEPFTTGQGLVLDHNPTASIATQVATTLDHATSAVLPVSYQRTKSALLELFDTLKPRVWVGMGFAPHRATLDLEAVALNVEHAVGADNDGHQPFMGEIFEGAPTAYRTRLKLNEAISTFAAHGVPAQVSTHAGTFLCNQAFYLGCHRCETTGTPDLAAFIHVPPMTDFGPFEAGLAALLASL